MRVATLGRLPFTLGFDLSGTVERCGGGIGAFGVQLAVQAGAHVTALTRRASVGAAADLGAHEVRAREDGPPGGAGERWDVVLDTSGTTTAASASTLLRDGGVLVTTRPVSLDAILARLRPRQLSGGRRLTAVMTAARSQDLARLARLVDQGRLRVPVDSVHDMQDAGLAHKRAESSPVGKVLVVMA